MGRICSGTLSAAGFLPSRAAAFISDSATAVTYITLAEFKAFFGQVTSNNSGALERDDDAFLASSAAAIAAAAPGAGTADAAPPPGP